VIFTAVFLAPWIERRITGDRREHHLLDRPRDAPGRTASGAAVLALITVLFVGGGQDVVARMFDMRVGRVTTILQITCLVAPVVTWFVTWRVCRLLHVRPQPERTERVVAIVRDPSGGYRTVGQPVMPAEAEQIEVEQVGQVEAG
jgi:ubiquinol-cytochrome c reductase cytochrome b subunit